MLVNRSVLPIICCSNSSSLEPVRCTFYDVKSKKIFLLWCVHFTMHCSKSLTQPINNSESLYFWPLLPPFSELHAQVKSNVENFGHNEIYEGISLLLIHRYLQRTVCCLRYRKFQLTYDGSPEEKHLPKNFIHICARRRAPNSTCAKENDLLVRNLILSSMHNPSVSWSDTIDLYFMHIYNISMSHCLFLFFTV